MQCILSEQVYREGGRCGVSGVPPHRLCRLGFRLCILCPSCIVVYIKDIGSATTNSEEPQQMFDLIATPLVTMAAPALAPADAPVIVCQFEDGNPDGSVCEWVDPGSGAHYQVDSRNYTQ